MTDANQARLKVEYVDIDSLVAYANNAKIHTEKQIEQIAHSIEQFGNCDPCGVWTNTQGQLEIVEGHGRVLALKSLGATKVPVIRLDHLDADARRAYCHTHNQLTMNTSFDMQTLTRELEELSEFDWDALGFDTDAISAAEDMPSLNQDEIPSIDDVEKRAKAGDLFKLGEHWLLCADATNPKDVKALMDAGDNHTANLLLTDPPYNVSYQGETKDNLTILNDSFKSNEQFCEFLYKAFSAIEPHIKAGGAFYVWYANAYDIEFKSALLQAGLNIKQNLVWVKNNLRIGNNDYHFRHEPCFYGWKPGSHYFVADKTRQSVFNHTPADIDKLSKSDAIKLLKQIYDEPADVLFHPMTLHNTYHPTTKPVGLFSELIRNSTIKSDTVVDIFAGSGTTLICCEQMARKSKSLELDPRYVNVIIDRWQTLTGGIAELVKNIYES